MPIKTLKGAFKTVVRREGTRRRKKATKEMRKTLVEKKTSKEFKRKYGREFVKDPNALFRIDRLRKNKVMRGVKKSLKIRGL